MLTLIVIVVVVILAAIAAWIYVQAPGAGRQSENDGRDLKAPIDAYALRPSLLSAAEYSFFLVLLQVLSESHFVAVKVRLGDLVDVKPGLGRSGSSSARNKINQKHVDFVVFDRSNGRPLVVIELDDASHGRADRSARDLFVDQVMTAVGLDVRHVAAAKGYALEDVRRLLPSLERNQERAGGAVP